MKLYLKYFAIHLKTQMEYKSSFFLLMAGPFLTSFSALLSMYFLFSRFPNLEGFSLQQVLLCFAVVLMAFSLAECFARGFDLFPQVIGNGEFDRAMLRPRSLILQVLGQKIEFTRLGRLVQAVLVFCYAIPASGVVWTPMRCLTLVLMVACGAVVFASLFLVYAAFCFFTLESLEFMNIFTDGGREFAAYPLSIYGRGILRFCTFVIPMALFQYYPLLFLIGRDCPGWYGLLPLASLFFCLPCYAFWRFGVRCFRSTGS